MQVSGWQPGGAASGPRDAGFCGHLVLALIFNRRGARFIDETLGDHLTAMAAIEQPQARVLVVADQRVRDEWVLGAYVEGIAPIDRFELCRRRGGRYAWRLHSTISPTCLRIGAIRARSCERRSSGSTSRHVPAAHSSRAVGSTRCRSTGRRTTSSRRLRPSPSRSAVCASTTADACSTIVGGRSRGCSRPAPTQAACTYAPTRAVSPLPRCSACVLRRPHSALTVAAHILIAQAPGRSVSMPVVMIASTRRRRTSVHSGWVRIQNRLARIAATTSAATAAGSFPAVAR